MSLRPCTCVAVLTLLLLGVGLHSYGFMAAAFWWLLAFVARPLAVIALAQLPLEKWRSFRTVL